MEWNLKVPKIAHFFWGGSRLPYLRYLSIKSFMNYNPDWKINLWHPISPAVPTWDTGELKYDILCDDYLPELLNLPINKKVIDVGIVNEMSDVHISDALRLWLLSTIGGLWSDMDILYFKPINDLKVNSLENRDKDTFVCISEHGHSIGFLMATENNNKFARLLKSAELRYKKRDYQCIGSTMYNEIYPTILSMDAVYPHDANHVSEILNGSKPRFTDGTIGIHWYAGWPAWSEFFKATNGGLTNLPNSIIGDLLKNKVYA